VSDERVVATGGVWLEFWCMAESLESVPALKVCTEEVISKRRRCVPSAFRSSSFSSWYEKQGLQKSLPAARVSVCFTRQVSLLLLLLMSYADRSGSGIDS